MIQSINQSINQYQKEGFKLFFQKLKNAIGIDGIWTRGYSMTNDAANHPATKVGGFTIYLYTFCK